MVRSTKIYRLTKKYRRRAFFVYFLVSALLIIALSVLYNQAYNREVKTNETSKLLNKTLTANEKKQAMLNRLIATDGLVILEADYNAALKQYKSLLNQAEKTQKDIIQQRINQLSQLLENEQNNQEQTDYKNFIIHQKQTEIKKLQNDLDSLQKQILQKENTYEKKLNELENILRSKERQINQKDRLKVLTFKNENGATIHYLGEVNNDKANGGGVGIWSTGSIYKGSWKDNQRHGKGVFEWKDGQKYDGNYVEDKREGKGTYYWPSGERYEGEWKNDRRNGFGILYDQDNNIRYEGNWIEDKPEKN